MTTSDWRQRLLWPATLIAWSALVLGGLVLLGRGVQRTGYFEPTAEALERARGGDLLIFAGLVTTFAAAGWPGGCTLRSGHVSFWPPQPF